jgi:hypothetical protein
MAKGKKTCPTCNVVVGARTKVCACGYVFIKNTVKEASEIQEANGVKQEASQVS